MQNIIMKSKNAVWDQAIWHTLSHADRGLIKGNRELKNRYKGHRCFIIGNGPSLKKQDLEPLRQEYVFTVNQMMRDERFDSLRTNFHVMADPLYFDLDLTKDFHRDVARLLGKISSQDNHPLCFFPIQARKFVNRLDLGHLTIRYFASGCGMYDGYGRDINYARVVPGFYNVVQYAITLAVFLGFGEIYIIGCDMTGYKEIEEKAFHNYEDKHCYHMTEEEKKNVLHKDRTCEQYFNGFAHMFSDYRRLYEYTQSKGIKLVNATEGGVLDSLPRMNYEAVLRG